MRSTNGGPAADALDIAKPMRHGDVASLHRDDEQIPSCVGFQRQFIWVVLLVASWSEVLSYNVVFRGPTIVTLAPQPSLPNDIVRYFIDLKVSHTFDISDRGLTGLRAGKIMHPAIPPALTPVKLRLS